MDLIDFLKEVSAQSIVERDIVNVVFNETETITGALVPYGEIENQYGDITTRIIHPRVEGPLISVKTTPDGFGPDVGTPVSIESIISITKV